MPKKNERPIVEMCTEILGSTAGAVHKKEVFCMLAKELDSGGLAKVAVEQFTATKDTFYLEKLTEIVDEVLKASVYDTGKCAKYAVLCERIQEVCENNRGHENLETWIDQLIVVVLQYAPVCNCNEFIITILNVAARCNVSVATWMQVMMNAYKATDKTALLVESVTHYAMALESKCTCVYWAENWDDDGWILSEEYDPQRCDNTGCNIMSCIMSFVAAICRHKSWIDSVWKATGSYKAMQEEYKEHISDVEEAYQLLMALNCRLPNMELFTKQWELFSSKYIHRKQLRNFDLGLEIRSVPAIVAESEI